MLLLWHYDPHSTTFQATFDGGILQADRSVFSAKIALLACDLAPCSPDLEGVFRNVMGHIIRPENWTIGEDCQWK